MGFCSWCLYLIFRACVCIAHWFLLQMGVCLSFSGGTMSRDRGFTWGFWWVLWQEEDYTTQLGEERFPKQDGRAFWKLSHCFHSGDTLFKCAMIRSICVHRNNADGGFIPRRSIVPFEIYSIVVLCIHVAYIGLTSMWICHVALMWS